MTPTILIHGQNAIYEAKITEYKGEKIVCLDINVSNQEVSLYASSISDFRPIADAIAHALQISPIPHDTGESCGMSTTDVVVPEMPNNIQEQ